MNTTEQNQSLDKVKVNHLVVIHKHQRSDPAEEGKKLGYSWDLDDVIGVVVAKGETSLRLKLPNGKTDTHDQATVSSQNYYFTYSEGTDFAFEEAVRQEIKNKNKQIQEMQEERDELYEWLQEFRNSIGFINKLIAFAKGFNA